MVLVQEAAIGHYGGGKEKVLAARSKFCNTKTSGEQNPGHFWEDIFVQKRNEKIEMVNR
jgi:hypothetical protein